MPLDIYGFVGLIMLIGIIKKNAIMMVDFALELERTGSYTASESAYQGCMIRANGSIMLADQENRDYKLVGHGKTLDSYVGQEVKITASDVNPGDPSSNQHGMSDGEAQNTPRTLSVEDIQKVSNYCRSPK